MLYVDTSVIVAAMGKEQLSPVAVRWLAANSAECVISSWTVAELSNVYARRARLGELSFEQHEFALAAIGRLVQSFTRVALGDVDVTAAAQMVDRWDVGVRVADAVHLAAARRHDCALVTFDRRMRDAARAFGVSIVEEME